MTSRHRMASDASTDPTFHAKQIVFLFMAATVVAVVVFLCGVLVGRGVPVGGSRGRGTDPASLGRRAINDLSPATLSIPSSEPSAAALTSDDLTYPRRLRGGTGESDRVGDCSGAPVAPPVEAEAVVSAEVEGGENDPGVEESSPRVEEPVSVGADFESPVVPEGAYVVQVIALQALAPAQQIAAGLVEKGFQAFVLDPFPDDPVTFYRVQVGPFAGKTEAARIRDRLRSEEGLGPFITR